MTMMKKHARTWGVDLGKRLDRTGIVGVEYVPPPARDIVFAPLYTDDAPELHIGWAERHSLMVPYEDIASRVLYLVGVAGPDVDVIVDRTGVGEGVCEMFRARGLTIAAACITPGQSVRVEPVGSKGNYDVWVGKSDLIDAIQLSMPRPKPQNVPQAPSRIPRGTRPKLKLAKDIPHRRLLENELEAFHVTRTPTGRETYSARAGKNDDLVLACALAVWWNMLDRNKKRPKATAYDIVRSASGGIQSFRRVTR